MTETAKQIVDDIITDLTDRRGLRQEWDQIDREIQGEIRETWMNIIQGRLNKANTGL